MCYTHQIHLNFCSMQASKQKFPEAKILLNVSNHRLNRAFSHTINLFGLFFFHLVSHPKPFSKVERNVFFLPELVIPILENLFPVLPRIQSFKAKSGFTNNQLIFLPIILVFIVIQTLFFAIKLLRLCS